MRITVEIEEKLLANAMRITGETKMGPAVTKAASEFVKRAMVREFTKSVMAGEFADYPMTNDEIESAGF